MENVSHIKKKCYIIRWENDSHPRMNQSKSKIMGDTISHNETQVNHHHHHLNFFSVVKKKKIKLLTYSEWKKNSIDSYAKGQDFEMWKMMQYNRLANNSIENEY